MARFESGWIKFHRRVINEDIGWHGVQLAVWITLLCWATRFETIISWQGKPRTIPPGSIVTAIRELATHLKFSKDAVARALQRLVSRDSIRIESTTRGSLITICNWAEYQEVGEIPATQVRHEPDTNETLAGHQPDLIGEVKNKRSSKSKKVNPADSTLLWNLYNQELKTKGIESVHNGAKTNTLCKQLVVKHGLDKAKNLVRIYLSDNSPFVKSKAWPLSLLVSQQQEYLAKVNSARPRPPLTFGEDDEGNV